MVALTLQANDGNIRKTARETGVPFTTVKDWQHRWDKGGYPENLQEALPAVRAEFIDEAVELRWRMVEELRKKVEQGQVSPAQLVAGIGMLTDKINVMRGLATARTETVHTNAPDPQEFAKALAEYVNETVEAANTRHGEIEDAEIVEQAEVIRLPALPPA